MIRLSPAAPAISIHSLPLNIHWHTIIIKTYQQLETCRLEPPAATATDAAGVAADSVYVHRHCGSLFVNKYIFSKEKNKERKRDTKLRAIMPLLSSPFIGVVYP